jgi:hypothetical protein
LQEDEKPLPTHHKFFGNSFFCVGVPIGGTEKKIDPAGNYDPAFWPSLYYFF